MTKTAKMDKHVARRFKELGSAGEYLTEQLLKDNGFANIRNLNHDQMNFPFADFYAERNNIRYVISAKTRNKYEWSPDTTKKRLNSRYNLGSKCYEHAELAQNQFKAEAAWLTIAIDSKTFSAYFGLLSGLDGSLGVTMTEKATSKYECFAKDQEHGLDFKSFLNVYESVASPKKGTEIKKTRKIKGIFYGS